MSIHFQCTCGKTYVVDDSKAGRTVRCKECGEAIVIPDAEVEFVDELDGDEDGSYASPARRAGSSPGSRRRSPQSVSDGSKVLYWVLGIVGGLFFLMILTCGGCMFFAKRAANDFADKMEKAEPEIRKAMEELQKQAAKQAEEEKKKEEARKAGIPPATDPLNPTNASPNPNNPNPADANPAGANPTPPAQNEPVSPDTNPPASTSGPSPK